ncbi:MAG: efflux RND transporter periplasmic adaptor subunit [Siphonobacter sp.]
MKYYSYQLLIAGLLLGGIVACQEKVKTEHHQHDGHSHEEQEEHKEHEEHEEEAELNEAQYKAAQIQLGSIERRAISGTLQVSGSLLMPPQQKISIAFPYGGIVRSTTLLPGKWVNKGQTLLTLENPEFITLQQDYLEAQSQLHYAEKEYQRQEELSKENVSAAKTFQRIEAELKALKIRIDGLKQKLSLLNLSPGSIENGIQRNVVVIAPASGYVTKVNINVGKAVQANEMLAELADTHFLNAELNVFEKDVVRLKVGQKVQLRLANEERNATIFLIGREIGAERMVKVLCKLDQPDRDLLPGTYLTAMIESGAAQVDALPEVAVVRSGEKQYIFVSEGKHNEEGAIHYPFRRLEVQTGAAQNGYIQVLSTEKIEKGTVVVKGAYDLLSKMNNSEHDHAH